jgi:hypothetical protein
MQDQDLDTDSQDLEEPTERSLQLDQVREFSRLVLKRTVAIICFGPGVLGFLWLISRILRR